MPATTAFQLSITAAGAAVVLTLAAKLIDSHLWRLHTERGNNPKTGTKNRPTTGFLILAATILLSSTTACILVITAYFLYGLHIHQIIQATPPGPNQEYLQDSILVYGVLGCAPPGQRPAPRESAAGVATAPTDQP